MSVNAPFTPTGNTVTITAANPRLRPFKLTVIKAGVISTVSLMLVTTQYF